MSTKKIKDLKIEIIQEGTGDDVLLLHGWGGNIESLKGLQLLLSEKGNRVTNLSLPGFGNSDAPPSPWNMKDFALFVEELILELKLKKPVIIGHSFGGKVGIKVALEFPELISKLVLISPSGVRPKNSAKKIIFGTISKVLRPLMPNKLKDAFYRYIVRETDYSNSGELKETFKIIVNEHLDNVLSQLQVPTQIIWASNDTYVPVWMAHIMDQEIPNSSLIIVDDATHGLPLTDPGKVAELILADGR